MHTILTNNNDKQLHVEFDAGNEILCVCVRVQYNERVCVWDNGTEPSPNRKLKFAAKLNI